MEYSYKRNRPYFHYLEIPITAHCNLNCFRCNHYAPLAHKWNISIDEFTRYIVEIKRITADLKDEDQKWFSICLMGGEPLLHPNLLELCKIAREYLPKNYIYICTNGILLTQLGQESFDKLNEYKIGVQCSNYKDTPAYNNPEILDIIYNKVNQFYWPNPAIGLVKNHEGFVNSAINFVTPHNSQFTYSLCQRDNVNIGIRHDKIYKCPQVGCIDILFDYFNIDASINYDQSKDILDLYSSNYKDIENFLKYPAELCKYCQFFYSGPPIRWQQSKKDISEWVQDYNKGE